MLKFGNLVPRALLPGFGGSKAREKRPGTRLKFGCYHDFPTIILQIVLEELKTIKMSENDGS